MKFAVVLALAAVLGGAYWWYEQLPPRAKTAKVNRGPAVEAIYATGTVEPVVWAKIASSETGRIVEYPAREGDHVTAGDLLFRLEDAKARAAVQELDARVDFLTAERARYLRLYSRDTVSQQSMERVESELAEARAARSVAIQRLKDLSVSSPLDGVVLRREREVGEVVRNGEILAWVGRDRPYWITADIDEEDIPRVRIGQTALITADAFPARVLEGEVSEITPLGDPVNKQYRARIALPASSPLLLGMTAEINIVVRENLHALLVPIDALVGRTVWVVEGNSVQRRDLKLGVFGNGVVEVLAGLDADDVVVISPPDELQDGLEIRAAP